MKRCIRRQRSGGRRRSPERARTILEFRPDVFLAEIEELGQRLLRVCIRNTFDELVNSANSI